MTPDETFELAKQEMIEAAERLERVESMIIYMLETTEADQVVRPNIEQAKALQVMGQAPWPTITRKTNKFQIWLDSWQALQASRQAATAGTSPSDEPRHGA
jgi:translation elongation factor EF-Tu-like GTPase